MSTDGSVKHHQSSDCIFKPKLIYYLDFNKENLSVLYFPPDFCWWLILHSFFLPLLYHLPLCPTFKPETHSWSLRHPGSSHWPSKMPKAILLPRPYWPTISLMLQSLVHPPPVLSRHVRRLAWEALPTCILLEKCNCVRSGEAGTRASAHMGCWLCRWKFYPLCHNTHPTSSVLIVRVLLL